MFISSISCGEGSRFIRPRANAPYKTRLLTRSGWRAAYAIAKLLPWQQPRRIKRRKPAASATASRSRRLALNDRSLTLGSDRPQPLPSYRAMVYFLANSTSRGRQTGLCHSNSRWLSQVETSIIVGPRPVVAYAMRTPSEALQKWICGILSMPRSLRSNQCLGNRHADLDGRQVCQTTIYQQTACPLLAQSGHGLVRCTCPLLI
jgi:hypothetical protein